MKIIVCKIAFFIVVCSANLIAQDTIYTRNGRQLFGKVDEINTQNVKFHRSDNLSGPVYVYDVCELDRIAFANGSAEKFVPCNTVPVSTQTTVGQPPIVSQPNANLNINLSTLNRQSMTETPIPANSILYTGLHTFHINNVIVPRQMVRQIMQKNNSTAFKEFDKGFVAENAGIALEVVGCGALVGALVVAAARSEDENSVSSGRDDSPSMLPVAALGGIGALLCIFGIGAKFSSRDHYSRAVLMYNEDLTQQTPPVKSDSWQWALGPTPGGIGVSVRF
jgi:hypothetical protein